MSDIEDTFEPIADEQAEAAPEPGAITAEPEAIEDTPEPVTEPEPAAEAPAMVPLATMMAERDKRQQAEAELQSRQSPPAPMPDVIDDPEGFSQAMLSQNARMLHDQKLGISKFAAESQFGSEKVAAAFEFFAKNPALSQQFASHASPYHAAVEFHQKQLAIEEIGDPATYEERVRAKIMAENQAQQVAASIKAPPSLAHETSVGGRVAVPADHTSLDILLA